MLPFSKLFLLGVLIADERFDLYYCVPIELNLALSWGKIVLDGLTSTPLGRYILKVYMSTVSAICLACRSSTEWKFETSFETLRILFSA
jgi:hypothetical protein